MMHDDPPQQTHPMDGHGAYPHGTPHQDPYSTGQYAQPHHPMPAQMMNQKAIVSMVLGVIALFVPVPFVLGVLAIVFANQAKAELEQAPTQTGEGFAIAGYVLGWIDIVLSLLVVTFFLSFFLGSF